MLPVPRFDAAPQTPARPRSHLLYEPLDAACAHLNLNPPPGHHFCMLQNSSDFYRWLGELEAARSSETEGKFRRYAAAAASSGVDRCLVLLLND